MSNNFYSECREDALGTKEKNEEKEKKDLEKTKEDEDKDEEEDNDDEDEDDDDEDESIKQMSALVFIVCQLYNYKVHCFAINRSIF